MKKLLILAIFCLVLLTGCVSASSGIHVAFGNLVHHFFETNQITFTIIKDGVRTDWIYDNGDIKAKRGEEEAYFKYLSYYDNGYHFDDRSLYKAYLKDDKGNWYQTSKMSDEYYEEWLSLFGEVLRKMVNYYDVDDANWSKFGSKYTGKYVIEGEDKPVKRIFYVKDWRVTDFKQKGNNAFKVENIETSTTLDATFPYDYYKA